VVADLQEAATFFEREGSSALAVRFLAEFRRVSRLLIEQPAIGSPRTGGRRVECAVHPAFGWWLAKRR
jgi:hypothetical protein